MSTDPVPRLIQLREDQKLITISDTLSVSIRVMNVSENETPIIIFTIILL
jgi:hypothetical protein